MQDFLSDPLDYWSRHLGEPQPVVLAATRDALAAWRERPEQVDANALADVALRDPLMALRVLIEVAHRLGSRLSRPAQTVTAGLVLLGIEPFFRAFADLPTLEDKLQDQPRALAGALALVAQSHRAARLAAAFAVHRQDEDAETLHQAALLSHVTGLLLWAQAPLQAQVLAGREDSHPLEDPADAQRAVLGIQLGAVEQALLQLWHLPSPLREMMQPGLTALPGPRCVELAVRIARHSRRGWEHPALPDDFAELGRLLHLPSHAARALAREVEDCA